MRIWSTEAIYKAQDPSFKGPRQLCHMSHHLGTIHSVRFSPNNRYLASGADDKIICVYQLDKSTPATTFGKRPWTPGLSILALTEVLCRIERASSRRELEDT